MAFVRRPSWLSSAITTVFLVSLESFVGVDVFFVVSGFLITSLIDQQLDENRLSLVSFYERRIRRLFPALVVLLLGCSIVACVELFPAMCRRSGQVSWRRTSSFRTSSFGWRLEGHSSPVADQKPLLHTWSLAVEEQFYLFLPPLMILLARCRKIQRQRVLFVLFKFFPWASLSGPHSARRKPASFSSRRACGDSLSEHSSPSAISRLRAGQRIQCSRDRARS